MLATYATVIRFCVCHILKFSSIDYDETLFACVVHATTHTEMTWHCSKCLIHIMRLCESKHFLVLNGLMIGQDCAGPVVTALIMLTTPMHY